MDNPIVQQVLNELPFLKHYLTQQTDIPQSGHDRLEADRRFAEKFPEHGTLEEFMAHYLPSVEPFNAEEACQNFDDVAKKVYTPQIIPPKVPSTSKFDMLAFLKHDLENHTAVPINFCFEETQDADEDEDEEDDKFMLDLSMREIGKVGLMLNRSGQFKYPFIEIKDSRSVVRR